MPRCSISRVGSLLGVLMCAFLAGGAEVPLDRSVDGQPLGANIKRLLQTLEFLGQPMAEEVTRDLLQAAKVREAGALQEALDPNVLLVVQINPEYRVKVSRGPAPARLQQNGYTPCLVKVLNAGTIAAPLRPTSPQSGAVYAGAADSILERQQQTELNRNQNTVGDTDRFLGLELYTAPPMTEGLSGLTVEYALLLIYASEAGQREATIGFEVGQGTQDLGFRGEAPVLFDISPSLAVPLVIRDDDGTPTTARLTFKDRSGRVYPAQAKRLAPDFFFQPQIYRADGTTVSLPPGTFELTYGRGPEYRDQTKQITVSAGGSTRVEVDLKRWIDPRQFGFVSGDHHIHGAGCSHYQSPTEGVSPADMFQQVKGEGLNVGCVLTWGPCFAFQRRYFSPDADAVSEPLTVLKYDLEISGFGSQALGHVCLLNLKDQTYPGSEGTSTQGWPTWTVPVMRWAKAQGGVTGYPHSDMFVDPEGYARRYLKQRDANQDGQLDREEAEVGLLVEAFGRLDRDGNGRIDEAELTAGADRAGNQLPNLVLPSMGGAGAMEIFVSTAEGVCDFISAMNTGRIGEWNTWYHLMNCGFSLTLSGETDFPCMSSRRVGQGRVYVKMGEGLIERVDFSGWCRGLAEGRSYVSDGYAHAVAFEVDGESPGFGEVRLEAAGRVVVKARVAFAPELPKAVAYGTLEAPEGRRHAGDTRILHAPRSEEVVSGGERLVEIVRNGEVVARASVPADGEIHDLDFELEVQHSSWIALRQFPQLHTNPVRVLIGGRPIRASRESARWCAESVEWLWERRSRHIAPGERAEAKAAYDRALGIFRQREAESR